MNKIENLGNEEAYVPWYALCCKFMDVKVGSALKWEIKKTKDWK